MPGERLVGELLHHFEFFIAVVALVLVKRHFNFLLAFGPGVLFSGRADYF